MPWACTTAAAWLPASAVARTDSGGGIVPGWSMAPVAGWAGAGCQASGGNITYAPVIDARGADAGAVARIERVLAEQSRNFGSNVQATNRLAQVRNVRA